MINFYSTGCPKCKVLDLKLKQVTSDINYITDSDKITKVAKEANIMSAPFLEVDGKFYEFNQAVQYINSLKK